MVRNLTKLSTVELHDGLVEGILKIRKLVDIAEERLMAGDEMECASLLGEAGQRGVFEHTRMMNLIAAEVLDGRR